MRGSQNRSVLLRISANFIQCAAISAGMTITAWLSVPLHFLVLIVRGMLWDLVKFSGLYGLVLMGFSLAYYVLLHDTAPHSYGLLRNVRDSPCR